MILNFLRRLTVTGPVVPDDRNMLNEQLWSPDRPQFRGRKCKGTIMFLKLMHTKHLRRVYD